jgi:serine/threonine protein kinase
VIAWYVLGTVEEERLIAMAQERGWITPGELDRVRVEQQSLADRGVQRSLWFLLLDLGLITDEQARELRKSVSSTRIRALEVDGYVIEGRLGSGGMGDVFRARNASGTMAAVKLLNSKFANNLEHRRRFAREARAGLRLRHPHIVPVLGAGEVDGIPYLIMEVVEGDSLKARIAQSGPLSVPDALAVLTQMASALAYAWSHGVLHRDVKPANILIGPPRPGHDEPFCARLIDFGLAKVWQEGSSATSDPDSMGGLTGAGLALGTPHYMSPEQAAGDRTSTSGPTSTGWPPRSTTP